MTHAALKDLLPCPFCGGVDISDGEVLSEKDDGTRFTQSACLTCGCLGPEAKTNGPDYGDTLAITAWNRRAALSAMEGEAVGWLVHGKYHGRPELGNHVFFYCGESGKVSVEAHRQQGDKITPLYTAPPPQQAVVPALEVFRISGGDVECCPNPTADEAMECLRDLRECYNESLATHPTPSPGPQGGGEAVRDAAFVKDLRFLIAYTIPHPIREFVISNLVDRGWLTDGGDRSQQCELTATGRALVDAALATPPAHQPGEVVTDAMVNRAALRFCKLTGRADEFANGWGSIIREVVTAALAPKEDGHG